MAIATEFLPTTKKATANRVEGLTEQEVVARRQRGEGNNVQLGTSRSYFQIVRENAFTFINNILFSIGFVLVAMGRVSDAVVTAGLVLINVIVGVVQEARAKRKLDQIALLSRPRATVVRDGHEQHIDPSQIVVGDILTLHAGDQIVVDGELVGEGRMDVDESLLTGESDLVPKIEGDTVYSGSFVVTGSGLYVARKVGAQSLAHQITAGARAFRKVKTPLQRDVDFVVRVLVFTVSLIGMLLAGSFLVRSVPLVEGVMAAAVVVGLVPQGLFLTIAVTYAIGAVRMAGKGALIQQANAIESMSNVDVVALDKTGTLTTNNLKFYDLAPLTVSREELAKKLGDYVASSLNGNRTAEAIAAALPGEATRICEEVPFSSARKWSAICFDDPKMSGNYVLGAPEMIQPALAPGSSLGMQGTEWTELGYRVVLLAYSAEQRALHDANGEPQLPSNLTPLGLVSFSDELRPEAKDTLREFAEAGIQVKIISGDNPHTVAALARQAGLGTDIKVVSGLDLAGMDDAQFAQTADEATIFGRITPQQKEALVRALRNKGHYVAMIGDGVNDVLSLKQSQLGIAMQSGSQATRGVADMVLLNDSFSVLPGAIKEGQRIINGMHDAIRLLLARTLYLMLLIVGAAVVGVQFPLTPKHSSILALLTVGIPTLALAVWAQPGAAPRRLLRSVVNFVVPAAFTVSIAGLGIYVGYLLTTGDLNLSRTVLTTATVLCGLALIAFVEPPTPAWTGGNALSSDKRPAFLAVGLLGLYLLVLALPASRNFFELSPMGLAEFAIVSAVVAVWAVVTRFIWRQKLLERLLGRQGSN